jgi:hypothetical protein
MLEARSAYRRAVISRCSPSDGIITITICVAMTRVPQCIILPRVPYANCPFLGLTLATELEHAIQTGNEE